LGGTHQKPLRPEIRRRGNKKTVSRFRQQHRKWEFSEYKPMTAEMIHPIVLWNSPNGSSWQLHADSAIHTNGVWLFFNVTEYAQTNESAPLLPFLQTNALAMPEFDETPSQIKSEIKINDWLAIGIVQKADVPLKDILGYLRLNPNPPRSISDKLLTELHGRIAAPWTCLGVVFIAIPFGVAPGRRNLFVGVAGSIAICFTYFVIQKVSLALGSQNDLPAWLAAWLPNLIFGATGLFLMLRVR